MLTGGTGTASAKQTTNAGSQYGNAWVAHPALKPGEKEDSLSAQDKGIAAVRNQPAGATCTRCGAWRGELGSEPTVGQYIANLVAVFRGVWRVLRDDGTLWVNLGSSYAGSHGNGYQQTLAGSGPNRSTGGSENIDLGRRNGRIDGDYKPKDLILTPFLLAEALRQDGWYLRSAITLCKVAPMPESVRDRPTNATEMLFLLSKRPSYYYDADAVRVPAQASSIGRYQYVAADGRINKGGAYREAFDGVDAHGLQGLAQTGMPIPPTDGRANLRSWLEWRPEPSNLQHYAAFPTFIPKLAIKAGSRHGDTVLDCFAGSGTSLLVATRLGRQAIGIELNAEYVQIARKRLESDAPLMDAIEQAPTPQQASFLEAIS